MRRNFFRTYLVFTALGIFLSSSTALAKDPVWREGRLELGTRLTHMELTDIETTQVLPMGGLGGYLRYRISRRLGVEGGLDILGSDELGNTDAAGEVMRLTVPISGSAMLYLFPNSRFQLYLLAGVGVAGNSVEFTSLGERMNFATPFAQLGIGGVYRFERVRLDFSLRSLMMTRLAEDVEIEALEPEVADIHPVNYQPYTGDRGLHGAMINIGLHWGLGRR